jgi:hypothetical protein
MFGEAEDDDLPIQLPAMGPQEEVFADYRTAGLSLKAHPVAFFRDQLDRLRVVPSRQLAAMRDAVTFALVDWCLFVSAPARRRELRSSRSRMRLAWRI